MRIFNSLGSNYDLAITMATFLIDNGQAHFNELTDYLQKRYGGDVYLTYKCREALLIGLKLLQLPAKSQVAITGFTCTAVEQAVKKAGLQPVFLDIELNNLNFTAQALKKALQENLRLKAVIIQNTLGQPADVAAIKELCVRHKLYLIEDLAHSLGARYDSKTEAGTVGDLVALSFSQDKVIDSVSGGALIVHGRQLRRKPLKEVLVLQPLPVWQQLKDRFYPVWTGLIRVTYDIFLGKILHRALKFLRLLTNPMTYYGHQFNLLPNWQAGLVMNGYIDLPTIQSHRDQIAQIYQENLNPTLLMNYAPAENQVCTWLRFPILVASESRQNLLNHLTVNGFSLTDIWYDTPIAPKKSTQNSSYKKGLCPHSETICSQIVNLPTHRHISTQKALQLCQIINDYLSLSFQERENATK